MKTLSLLAISLLVACGSSAPPGPSSATSSTPAPQTRTLVNVDAHRVALLGHDPVAYFTDGHPVVGDPAITAEHRGAVYRFASTAHRELFVADPDRYAPQFGGYCGYAASIGRLSPIDPTIFQILDGRLVLQHSPPALALWQEDVPGNLARADQHWPTLLAENGEPTRVLVNVDEQGIALGGYDPMSYREGTPATGMASAVGNHDGALYRFRTTESRYAFEDHPARFSPAFGGFDALGVSEGRLDSVDPTVFELVGDRLLVFHDAAARTTFDVTQAERLRSADAAWSRLLDAHGT